MAQTARRYSISKASQFLKMPSLSCPCCGWHRLIDTGKRTRSRTISPNDPEHPDADYYQKCPRCGEQVGIKKIE